MGKREESHGHNPFENFRDGFEEDDDAKRGRHILGGLAGVIQDHPICVFEAGRVVAECNQGGEEVKEDVGIVWVHLFPDPVRYAIWSRG